MKRYIAMVVSAVILSAGMFAAATAQVDDAGPIESLRRRVKELEDRAERQRRALVDLRNENADQQGDIDVLIAFRDNTNNSIQYLLDRSVQMEPDGTYTGPIRANQVSSLVCHSRDAVWQQGSLGCRGGGGGGGND